MGLENIICEGLPIEFLRMGEKKSSNPVRDAIHYQLARSQLDPSVEVRASMTAFSSERIPIERLAIGWSQALEPVHDRLSEAICDMFYADVRRELTELKALFRDFSMCSGTSQARTAADFYEKINRLYERLG